MKNKYVQLLSTFIKKNISLLLIVGALLLSYYGAIKLNPMQEVKTNKSSEKEESFVTKNNEISVIKFFAPWCGPCRQMTPIFDATAKSFEARGSKCQFSSVNIDEQPSIAEGYKIRGIPAIVIVDASGQVREKIVGFVPQVVLEEKIGKHCHG
jgi:thioredoxin 1